jgi:NADP-dependent 3-hydroxy acid dehydrogenase YdfG
MAQRTWFITGVSSGFGRELTKQLLERGAASSEPFATLARSLIFASSIPRRSAPRCST